LHDLQRARGGGSVLATATGSCRIAPLDRRAPARPDLRGGTIRTRRRLVFTVRCVVRGLAGGLRRGCRCPRDSDGIVSHRPLGPPSTSSARASWGHHPYPSTTRIHCPVRGPRGGGWAAPRVPRPSRAQRAGACSRQRRDRVASPPWTAEHQLGQSFLGAPSVPVDDSYSLSGAWSARWRVGCAAGAAALASAASGGVLARVT